MTPRGLITGRGENVFVSQEEPEGTCPRCGGALTAYTLGGDEAVECEACGYVGVSTDHRPEATVDETWEDAVQRFEKATDSKPVKLASGPPVELRIDTTTYRVTPALYERYADLTEKQQAIVNELLVESDPSNPDRSRAAIAEVVDAHPSYVSEVLNEYRDLAVALSASPVVDTSDTGSL